MSKNIKFWRKWNLKDIFRDCITGIGGPIKFWCYYRPKRRKLNQNNKTELVKPISIDYMKKIKIWNYTHGFIDVRFWEMENAYINIWSYCLIAKEVELLCGNDHHLYHFSNYPFWYVWLSDGHKISDASSILKLNISSRKEIMPLEHKCKWPIIIDDDVRIWTWAKVMSWVHIWQWAVIAAWAVVTKDIPPYAIAWWVPAKVIKYRFSEDKIKKLLEINYSNIPIEKFREIYPETIKEDFDIDYLLKKLKE